MNTTVLSPRDITSMPPQEESRPPPRNAFARENSRHRQPDAVLFTCTKHGNAVVLCATAGKIARLRRQAAVGATVFWCTCPSLNNALAHVEQSGAVQVINRVFSLYPSVARAHAASHAGFEARVRELLTEENAKWEKEEEEAHTRASSGFSLSSQEKEKEHRRGEVRKGDEEVGKAGHTRGGHVAVFSSSTEVAPPLAPAMGTGRTAVGPAPTSVSCSSSSSSSSLWEFYYSHFIAPPEGYPRKYGNGGMTRSTCVKCVHALVAQELCGAINPIGEAMCNYLCFLHQVFFQFQALDQEEVETVEGMVPERREDAESPCCTRLPLHSTTTPIPHPHLQEENNAAPQNTNTGSSSSSSGSSRSSGVGEDTRPAAPRRWQAVLMEHQAVLEQFLYASLVAPQENGTSSEAPCATLSEEKTTTTRTKMPEWGCPRSGTHLQVELPRCCHSLLPCGRRRSTTTAAAVGTASSSFSTSVAVPPHGVADSRSASGDGVVVEYVWRGLDDLQRSSSPSPSSAGEDGEGEEAMGSRSRWLSSFSFDLCAVAHEVIAIVNGKGRVAKKRRIN